MVRKVAGVEMLNVSTPRTEQIDNPYRDMIQDAWVRTLTVIKERDTILPEAGTTGELIDQYEDDFGLFQTTLNGKQVDFFRKQTNDHEKYIQRVSTSSPEADLLEHLEDFESELAFDMIEGRDELERVLADMPKGKRKAVTRFAEAWIMQEKGFPLSQSVKNRISEDRARYGLALELRKGTSQGGRKNVVCC